MGGRARAVANDVDKHIGQRIRECRRAVRMSQDTLAGALGVTFQQVQKYERGFNRVGASTLYEIAKTLNVAVGDFYSGLPSTTDEAAKTCALTHQPELARLMGSRDGAVIADFFPKIESPDLRHALAELVRATVRARQTSCGAPDRILDYSERSDGTGRSCRIDLSGWGLFSEGSKGAAKAAAGRLAMF